MCWQNQMASHCFVLLFMYKPVSVCNSLLFIELANYKWWSKSIEVNDYYGRESKTLNVEITAYALLTLMLNESAECLPILKWLLNQRNDKGGFKGTQDTIIGIEALANFAAKIASKDDFVNISVTTSNDTKHNFHVNKDNSLVLQSQKVNLNAYFYSHQNTIYKYLLYFV